MVEALPNTTIAVEGKSKSIGCTFNAKPVPAINWYMNDSLIINGSRIIIHTSVTTGGHDLATIHSTVNINDVVILDTGSIRCQAVLHIGNASSLTSLIMHCKFTFCQSYPFVEGHVPVQPRF